MEATHGSIVIDDIDIKNIGTEDLRSNLTIIPQGKEERKIITALYNNSITKLSGSLVICILQIQRSFQEPCVLIWIHSNNSVTMTSLLL